MRTKKVKPEKRIRIFSFGGGVQSHGVLALQALGRMPQPYDYFVFANVGADSENPDTLDYIEKYTKPFCEAHDIKFVEVQKMRGRGKANKAPETLLEAINRDNRSVPIPAYMGDSGAPGNRSCTQNFKVEVVDGLCKQNDYTHVEMGFGISVDELRRVRHTEWHDRQQKTKPFGLLKKREYPLVDLRLTRADCLDIIASVGLPKPPKSSCWFCPYVKLSECSTMAKTKPALFQQVIEVEETINHKRAKIGRDDLFLSNKLVPIAQAVAEYDAKHDAPKLDLPFEDETGDICEEGVCMT